MKKLMRILILSMLSVFLVAGSAMALTFKDGGVGLQGVLDGITTAPTLGDSSVDVTADYLADTCDSYWSITGAGGSLATMIIELASFAENNLFGVYSDGQYVELFSGAEEAGDQALLSIKEDGSVFVNFADSGVDFSGNNFGFYLNSSYYTNGGLWHSDSALNSDGEDHLAVFQGTNTDTVQMPGFLPGLWTNNEYVFAFEDLTSAASDWDYTDMVVMVESVNPAPVPEPSTVMLVGAGLLGMIAFGRKRFNKKT
jgi:hypothetical protein